MLLVVGLCADWCHVCKEFEPSFARIAAEHPDARFLWLDIEDDAEVVGDIDVENFPTLAVFRDGRALHFGITVPQEEVVRRLIRALAEAGRPQVAVAEAVAGLPARLRPGR